VKYTDYKRYHTSVTILYNGQEVEKDPNAGPPASTPPKPNP
jgi:hypothetical protein